MKKSKKISRGDRATLIECACGVGAVLIITVIVVSLL